MKKNIKQELSNAWLNLFDFTHKAIMQYEETLKVFKSLKSYVTTIK